MKGHRKLIFGLLGLVILCGAFLLLLRSEREITDMMFGIWVTGILTIVGAYLGMNVRSKHWWVEEQKNGDHSSDKGTIG